MPKPPDCRSVDYWVNLIDSPALKEKSKLAFDVITANVKYFKTCENARKKWDKGIRNAINEYLMT